MTRLSSSPPAPALLGHLTLLRRDPLGFLTRCARGASGSVVPLRLPFVRAFLLLDPADIERVLVTDHRLFVKPVWLRTPAVRRMLGDGLVTSDGDGWRRQRRVCQPAFLPGLMPAYGVDMAGLTAQMLTGWAVGQTRDLLHEMTHLTLAIIGQTLLGVEMGSRQAAEISTAMDTMMECFDRSHTLFGLIPLPPTPREARAVRQLDKVVDTLIAEGRGCPVRKEPTEQGEATLLHHLSGERVRARREQVKTFLAAGHESSALALTWAFLLLAGHPDVEARLAEELHTVLGDRPPTPADLVQLPYTQAIIKETLRLYPPLWMTGRKARQPCEIGGHRIPAGALLLTSQWAVQRHPGFFPDPDAFRPERWLGPETADLPRFAYFPFGGGPRVCIGQGFAMMETGLLLAAIAQRFRLDIPAASQVQPWATMTLRPPQSIKVRLTTRD